jgi:hypothetical protein
MAVLDATIKAITAAIMQNSFIIAPRAPETDYPKDRSVSESEESPTDWVVQGLGI